MTMLAQINDYGVSVLGPELWSAALTVGWDLIKIVALVLPLLLCVAYLTLWERKAIGWSQIRPGPNRVGPLGLLQPIADAVKLIFKEIIRPAAANKGLFFLGPVMTIMPALAAWAVVPFGPEVAVSNINAFLNGTFGANTVAAAGTTSANLGAANTWGQTAYEYTVTTNLGLTNTQPGTTGVIRFPDLWLAK